MPVNRRQFLGATGMSVLAACGPKDTQQPAGAPGPSAEELEQVLAQPVLRTDGITSPVIIDSVRLLKKGKEYFVHVRSTGGAEGISLTNSRAVYLYPLLQQRLIPFLIGKDARDWENILWELYRWGSNYKLQGLAFWCCQAWLEFAVLDMLGRIANKPLGELLGGIVRKEAPYYIASGRRDSTPEDEVEYLQRLVEETGARAVKFRVGGRMSRNADASPGRTGKLISLSRKTLGDDIDIHADSNSSYDPPQAIKVGRMLEEINAVYFEEPCPFDHLEDTKVVTDTLDIPVAGGEQEFSERRFRWMIQNRGVDIVQPDLHYYGGLLRSLRVSRMADLAKMPTTVHISGGFGFIYMLHFASCAKDIGAYQEYKKGQEVYGDWFDPPLQTRDGAFIIPEGPGVGIKNIKDVLSGATIVI